VNGVTRVKNHEESYQQHKDYIQDNINEVQKLKKHRVLVLGDSHVRRCSDLINMKLNKEFSVSGIVQTGAKSRDILNTNIDKSMSKNDVIIVCAGNDISIINAKEGINGIISFAKKTSHTNIIVMEALHRHDLADLSCQ
jgi:hypothetical protein